VEEPAPRAGRLAERGEGAAEMSALYFTMSAHEKVTYLERELASVTSTAREATRMLADSEKKREALQRVLDRTRNNFTRVRFPDEVPADARSIIVEDLAREVAHAMLNISDELGAMTERAMRAEANLKYLVPFEKLPAYVPGSGEPDWSETQGARMYDQLRRLQLQKRELEDKIQRLQFPGPPGCNFSKPV
jgi:hypothetical protein